MRGGVILLMIGILLAYLAATGKYKCIALFFQCATGNGNCQCNDTATQTTSLTGATPKDDLAISLPKLPPLPNAVIFNYGRNS